MTGKKRTGSAREHGLDSPNDMVDRAMRIADRFVARVEQVEEERVQRIEHERAKAIAAVVPGRIYWRTGELLEVKSVLGGSVTFHDENGCAVFGDLVHVATGVGYTAVDDAEAAE